MSEETYRNYLRDIVFELHEMASDAKKTRDRVPAGRVTERRFHEGVAWGILTALSLLIEQAQTFELPRAELGMEGVDIDKELANVGITKSSQEPD